MNDFKFRLQPVLDHRQRLYEKACGDLQSARNFLEAKLEELSRLEQEELLQREDLKRSQSGDMDVSEIMNRIRYLAHLVESRKSKQQEVAQREQEVCRCFQELIEISKDKKVIEKLRDKHLHDFLKKLLEHEQKVIDACALSRFVRTRVDHGQGEEA
ncbi:MAG: flagellar export protein FliJ [Candidatus Omnitrophica bacterium]|nr:flagellar export protein FliJ [Candidatus Omnitrophota bacterium]